MEFIKKLFRTQSKNDDAVSKMSSPEQEEEPMDVEDDNFDQELEPVDSPDENFDAAENTTEDEEDADEENRDPRSFLSTELRPHSISQNNEIEESEEEEAILENFSPTGDNQVDESNDGVDPLNEGEGENEDGEESNSARDLNDAKETTLLNGDDKAEDYEEDEDSGGKEDNEEPDTEINANADERNEDDEEEDITLNRDRKEEEEQESEVGINESDKEDEEQEAEIDLHTDEKDEEDEEREKQSNPFADEDSVSGDKEENEKEISLIDDEDTNQTENEENSREKEDLFVAAEDNSNSNSNEGSNKKNLFVSTEDNNDEDSCDKDANEVPKKDEVEVLDIGDESDEEDDKTVAATDGKGTEEHPVDLEADEEMSKTSNENSPDLRIEEDEAEASPPQSPLIKESKSDEDNEEEMPKIRISNLIFDQQAEEEEDDDNVDIQSMMQVEMMEDDDGDDVEEVPSYEASHNEVSSSTSRKSADMKIAEESPSRRILPRRAAARAAATTIREISSHELEDDDVGRTFPTGRRRSPDRDYNEDQPESPPSPSPRTYSHNQSANNSTPTDKHKCHICRRITTCPIVVRQFGSDVHMCSNSCFNTFRNPDPSKRPLPCAHCGILHRDTDDTAVYYWETMNFCSDMCVAKYQIEVGGKCATCIKKVAWNCLGKYCVRFGSDIRQFCTATCLEAYKKNARVCFHCQLDIKRLGNVVLANIPAKASPKEFCSQDCVEMYIEQNLKQMVRPKPGLMAACVMCGCNKEVHKEMVTANANFKICSDYCWRQLLTSKNINKPCKCESCIKYINMELDSLPTANYISTAAKVHGFCSATCKNVFVLKNRSILACTTCKVKKYNFDLIEYISNKAGAAGFAVCSLNCIPKGAQYIAKIKDLYNSNTYNSSLTASQLIPVRNKSITSTVDSNTVPIISSVTSLPQEHSTIDLESDSSLQIQSVVTLAEGEGETVPQDDQDLQMQMYETYEDDGSEQGDVIDEEFDADLDEMRRLYEEVVEQLETVTERDFYPEQRTVSCWAKPKVNNMETQTDLSELEKMERIEMVPQEKTIYVPVPIPYPVLLPFPFYALETPVPYPFPVPLPFPVPIPVIFPGTPKIDTNSSSVENMETDAEESADVEKIAEIPDVSEIPEVPEIAEVPDIAEVPEVESDEAQPPSPLPLNSSSRVLNDTIKDGNNGSGSPAGTSKTKSKPQTLSDSGIKAWRSYFGQDSDPTSFKSPELGEKLTEFVNRVTRPSKEKYPADTLLYLSLGIQQYLRDNGRTDYIFYDEDYSNFVQNFTNYAEEGIARDIVLNRVDESNFWETTELGAPSPGVLLFTVIYFNYKYFNLKTWEAHAALQFKDVVIVEREDMESGDKTKYLIVTTPDGVTTEIEEKSSLRERCPVRLFEFYQLKCASHEGSFYKTGNKIYTPRSEWFSEDPLDQMIIYRMLVRAMMVKSEGLSR